MPVAELLGATGWPTLRVVAAIFDDLHDARAPAAEDEPCP